MNAVNAVNAVNAEKTDPSPAELDSLFGGIPCQGKMHPYGLYGHDSGAPAAGILICPACGPRTAQCRGRIKEVFSWGLISCEQCGLNYPKKLWKVIEL